MGGGNRGGPGGRRRRRRSLRPVRISSRLVDGLERGDSVEASAWLFLVKATS
jgi:hypothetical protein